MAVNSRGGAEPSMAKKWRDSDTSPERTKIWVEPSSKSERKVPVLYYLCRNGQLEHPHFMEVSLSSPQGLFLRDVMNRLNYLRGKGMASIYSWSSKRSYKKGFVWQDLSENDIIHPVSGHEYILKGSELLEASMSFRLHKALPLEDQPDSSYAGEDCDSLIVARRRNQSWSSFDPHEYKVYKAELAGDLDGKATNAATQTDDEGQRRRSTLREDDEEQEKTSEATELSREAISPPPPSSSSPEVSEAPNSGALGNRSGDVGGSADIRDEALGNDRPSGRMKASAVLMQLIMCGTDSIKEGKSSSSKDQGPLDGAEYGTGVQRDAWNQGRVD